MSFPRHASAPAAKRLLEDDAMAGGWGGPRAGPPVRGRCAGWGHAAPSEAGPITGRKLGSDPPADPGASPGRQEAAGGHPGCGWCGTRVEADSGAGTQGPTRATVGSSPESVRAQLPHQPWDPRLSSRSRGDSGPATSRPALGPSHSMLAASGRGLTTSI